MKKKLTFIFFVLILSLSNTSFSYEVSELKLNLLRDPSGTWVPIAVDGSNFNSYLTELNLYEKQGDGSIVSPIFMQDKNGKQVTNVGWTRFSCSDDNLIDLGGYKNGAFDKNELLPESHLGHQIRYFFCPTKNDDGKRYMVSYASFDKDKKLYGWWGWSIDDLEKQEVDKYVYNAIWYNLTIKDKKIVILKSAKIEINCSDKTVFSPHENKKYSSNSNEAKHLRFFVNTACGVNGVLSKAEFENIKTAPMVNNENKLTSSPSINKKLSIEEAKEKCKELGFKDKTEKFGSCVLELIK